MTTDSLLVDALAHGAADVGVDGRPRHGDAYEVAVVPQTCQMPQQDLLDLRLDGIAVGQPGPKILEHACGLALHDCQEKSVLAHEVAMDQPFRATGPLRHLAGRRRVVAVLGEDGGRRLDERPLALILGVLASLKGCYVSPGSG